MKQLLFLSFFIVAAAFTSCGSDDKEDTIGDRYEYPISKKVMTIPASGGTDSIKNLSKDVPWVIMRFDVVIDGNKTAIQLSGNTEYDGGWFKAELSDDYKWIKVSVDNSMAAKQYSITIRMGLYSMDMGPYVNLTVKKKE